MDDPEELRVLRARLTDLSDRIEVLESAARGMLPGAGAWACKTVSLGHYPSSGAVGRVFAVEALEVTGVETEGAVASTTQITGPFLAANLGSGLPPVGTDVLVEDVAYARCFVYP